MVALTVFFIFTLFAIALLFLRQNSFIAPAGFIILILSIYGFSNGITYVQSDAYNQTCTTIYAYGEFGTQNLTTNMTDTCIADYKVERIDGSVAKPMFFITFFTALVLIWEGAVKFLFAASKAQLLEKPRETAIEKALEHDAEDDERGYNRR